MIDAFPKPKCPEMLAALKLRGGGGQSHLEQKTTQFTIIKQKLFFKIHE